MTRRRHRNLILLVAVTIALVAAACSGSGSGSGDDATTASTEPPPLTAAPAGEVADAESVPSAGCGTSVIGQVSDEQVFLDDSDRYFQFTTPPEHDGDTPVPLVLDFHGVASGAAVQKLISEMGAFGAANGFAVAVPHGTGEPVGWAIDIEDNPDVDYVDLLLDQVGATACIDTSRVYATGLSNGAFLTSALACTRADRFAAVAPVAGVLHPDGCDPSRPMPLLAMHGTDDAILLFDGGVGDTLGDILPGAGEGAEIPDDIASIGSEGYPAAAQAWADQNGCQPDPTDEPLTETVTARVWDCPADGAVEFLIIDGGGHSWPGSDFAQTQAELMGVTDTSIDANEQIWAFFQRFALPTT